MKFKESIKNRFNKEYRKIKDVIKDFEMIDPKYNGRLYDISKENREDSLNQIKNIKNPIAVLSFQQNLINEFYDNLSWIEKYNIPFIFTLYPGGGFKINNKESTQHLRRIFSSKNFKKVIVTQDITKEYLIQNKLCNEKQIKMIFGVVTPKISLNASIKNKKYYNKDKRNLDICFVAHKYSKKGIDKGYDLFVQSAKQLIRRHKNIRFHIVGEFDENDIDIGLLKKFIKFYGVLNNKNLKDLYMKMDLIISPTRPFKLSSGSFDGFPTGSSTEAMLNGVCLVTTDELNLNNNRYLNGSDLIIVNTNSAEITKVVENLYNEPDKIISIAKKGRKRVKKLYGKKNQIDKRIKIIDEVARKIYKR